MEQQYLHYKWYGSDMGHHGCGRDHTVQTFYSSTSRPDVCQCMFVQTPIDNMSNNMPSTPMTHVACESKLRFSCEVIHASMPRKLGDSTCRILCPSCSRIQCRNYMSALYLLPTVLALVVLLANHMAMVDLLTSRIVVVWATEPVYQGSR